jgi:hypothetical protein
VFTLCTAMAMTAREPGARSCRVGMYAAYSGVPNSCATAVPNTRSTRGAPSNATKQSVMRPFSRTCAIVSEPEPVRSSYQTIARQIQSSVHIVTCAFTFSGVHDMEGAAHPLWRHVDVSGGRERGRGNPEQMLRLYPWDEASRYLVVEFDHGGDKEEGTWTSGAQPALATPPTFAFEDDACCSDGSKSEGFERPTPCTSTQY